MKWLDIRDIAVALETTHSDADIVNVRFTDLRAWVLELSGFDDNPAHCSEKILEAIQAAWIDERD